MNIQASARPATSQHQSLDNCSRWLRAVAVDGQPYAVKQACVRYGVAFDAIDDMDVLRDGLLKLAADKVHAVANGTA